MPDTRIPLRLTVLLGALSAFGPLSTDMYLPGLPRVGADLHASASVAALTLTASVVGLGAGQLLIGPLSDRYGRRRPLVAGLVVFAVFSVACALAPNAPLLVGFRLLQALGGAAGIVLARAIARDLRSGPELARLFALLLSITGVAPVLAPVIGGQLIRLSSWRGVFVLLAVIGGVLVAATFRLVPETLPAQRRQPGGLRIAGRSYRRLLADRPFLLLVVTGGLAFAVMFSYISASSFVLQDRYGLSAQLFSLDFAVNALALTGAARLSPRVDVRAGLAVLLAGAVLVLLGGTAGAGLVLILPGFLLITTACGLVMPQVAARAMEGTPDSAGAASAVLGATQFLLGGVLGPIASIGAARGATALGITVTVTALLALVAGLRSVAGRVPAPIPA